MKISQQIVDLLLIESLAIAGHFVAAETNDVRDPIVIGGHPAHWQILLLKDALHAWTLPSSRRVRRMAAVAVVVIDATARDLLRIEAEFGIALAALDLAPDQTHHRDTETQSKQLKVSDGQPIHANARSFH